MRRPSSIFPPIISYVRLGDKISKNISEEFPDPIFLEFEKAMFPSMLVNRKVDPISDVAKSSGMLA